MRRKKRCNSRVRYAKRACSNYNSKKNEQKKKKKEKKKKGLNTHLVDELVEYRGLGKRGNNVALAVAQHFLVEPLEIGKASAQTNFGRKARKRGAAGDGVGGIRSHSGTNFLRVRNRHKQVGSRVVVVLEGKGLKTSTTKTTIDKSPGEPEQTRRTCWRAEREAA